MSAVEQAHSVTAKWPKGIIQYRLRRKDKVIFKTNSSFPLLYPFLSLAIQSCAKQSLHLQHTLYWGTEFHTSQFTKGLW